MQGQRAKHEINRTCRRKTEDIGSGKSYLGIGPRTLPRQFKGGRLKLDCCNPHAKVVGAAPIDHEAGNVTEPGAQIDRGSGNARNKPATQKIPNKSVAPEISIQFLE